MLTATCNYFADGPNVNEMSGRYGLRESKSRRINEGCATELASPLSKDGSNFKQMWSMDKVTSGSQTRNDRRALVLSNGSSLSQSIASKIQVQDVVWSNPGGI